MPPPLHPCLICDGQRPSREAGRLARAPRAAQPWTVGGKTMNYVKRLLFVLALICASIVRTSGIAAEAASSDSIASVVLHRLFREFYFCSEHFEGEEPALGDSLGTNCLVQRVVSSPSGKMVRAFQGDGLRNEDWYGWNAEVLAPFDAVV